MNVSLTTELTDFVAELVASGRYRSASEVVRAALRCLQKDEQEAHEKSAALPSESRSNRTRR